MPRPSNTEARRAQIADALIGVMAERGYDGASIADIATRAGLTPGLVHYHFQSKLDILLVALARVVQRHRERLLEHLAALDGSAAHQVSAFVDFHLGLGKSADPEALACWILLSGEALRQPKVQLEYERAVCDLVELVSTILRAGIAAGELHAEDPVAAAAAIVASIQGYFVLAATARSCIPRGSAARSTLRMAEGLLGASLPELAS